MAGMIASFWQAVPNLTNLQVVNFVKQSADRFSNPNAQYGYGIPDFQMAINSALLAVTENTENTFVLYPNPANGNISISNNEPFTNSVFVLYNNLGQIVATQKMENSIQNVSLENISKGIYFYKITSNSLIQSGKIIKN
jgi:hypothetical protein